MAMMMYAILSTSLPAQGMATTVPDADGGPHFYNQSFLLAFYCRRNVAICYCLRSLQYKNYTVPRNAKNIFNFSMFLC